jgi:hypothetical protein
MRMSDVALASSARSFCLPGVVLASLAGSLVFMGFMLGPLSYEVGDRRSEHS